MREQGPHLRGLPETSPGSFCRCTWTGPRYSPSSSSLCPAGEAEGVRRGARSDLWLPAQPAPRAPRAPPHAHRHPVASRRSTQAPPSRPLNPSALHACAEHVRRLRGAVRRSGALLGNIWRRLRRGPIDMAAAATVAWLPAAFVLFVAQVRAAPASSAPPDAVTLPLGPRPGAVEGPVRLGECLWDPRPPRGLPAGPEPRRDLAGLSPAQLLSPPRQPFPAAASLISGRV